MVKNINLDIAGLIFMVVILFSCISRKMTRGLSNRTFLAIMVAAILAVLFDITAVTLDNSQSHNLLALEIAHSGYLLTHFMNAPLHLLFILSLTDSWHKLRKHILLEAAMILPFVAVVFAFIVNAFSPVLFSVRHGYERGPWFPLLYISASCYIVYELLYIIRYYQIFDRGSFLAIGAAIPISGGSMLLQMAHPRTLIEMFATSISLMLISIGVQRPENYIDSFTQLLKHSAYVHDMKRSFYNKKHVRIIMLNIGNFHAIQSMVGFDASTEMLFHIANKIRAIDKQMQGHAELYYLDSGRYRMVFSGKYIERVEAIADVLNKELKKHMNINGLDISLTPFIVLARCPEEITSFRMLMYFGSDFHKKNPYTGQIMNAGELYSQNQLNIQNNIDEIIDRAIESNSFQVYYQPIYSTSHGKFISAEALLRLNDPEHGYISPETLVTAAEQSGAIHRIGEIVFEEVCQFIISDEFKDLGLDYIEINLSVAQIMNSDLPDRLLSIMQKYKIPPDKINLEITETAAAYTQRVMLENISRLKEAGLSFSLDDYGTGYSNMQRVIQLPLKIIKLDKSFVDEHNNPKMWIFLKNTVKMLKDMNMEIVVEGVESQEMLEAFSDMECDFIQGYYFSKPIPKEDFVAFISEANRA